MLRTTKKGVVAEEVEQILGEIIKPMHNGRKGEIKYLVNFEFIDNPQIIYTPDIQANLFQKHLFLHQLTHNMKKDFSLNYEFST